MGAVDRRVVYVRRTNIYLLYPTTATTTLHRTHAARRACPDLHCICMHAMRRPASPCPQCRTCCLAGLHGRRPAGEVRSTFQHAGPACMRAMTPMRRDVWCGNWHAIQQAGSHRLIYSPMLLYATAHLRCRWYMHRHTSHCPVPGRASISSMRGG